MCSFFQKHYFPKAISLIIIFYQTSKNYFLERFGKGFTSGAYLRTQPQCSSLPWCRTPHSWGWRVVQVAQNWSCSREWLTGTSLPSWCPQSRSCTHRTRRLRRTANTSWGLNLPPPLQSTHHGRLLRAVFPLLSWVAPHCSCSLAANYLWVGCAHARPSPAGIVMSYTDNGTKLGLAHVRENSPFSRGDWDNNDTGGGKQGRLGTLGRSTMWYLLHMFVLELKFWKS